MGDVLANLPAFAIAVLILAIVPGPATALVVRSSAVRGTRRAIPTIGGLELGNFAWALGSAAGLAALVAASQLAYNVLRVVGAITLIVLGVLAWRAARRTHSAAEPADDGQEPETGRWQATLGTGVVTNLANPKAAAFIVAFYPQFIPSEAPIFLATIVLGIVHVLVDAGWYLLVAVAIGKVRGLFMRSRVRAWLERISGSVLIGLGLRMAATSR